MIRKFIKTVGNNGYAEISTIDTENGDISRWCESDGLKFSEWSENVLKMGWKSVSEFIKNRRDKENGWEEQS